MNILLVCACGSSTSILMQSMKDNLHDDEQWNIEALSISDAKKTLGKYDYILMAPQVKFQTNMIIDLSKDYPGLTVMNVDSKDFGRCNGPAVLDMIRENEKNK